MIGEHLPSLGQLVLVLIAGWSTLLVTIAALWATNPRASWLCRLAPIGLLLAVLMPMGLTRFAIMFVCQAVIVFGVLVVSRLIRRPGIDQPTQAGDTVVREVGRAAGPYRWLQFSLGRLFASIFVGTTILALVLSAPAEDDIVDLSDRAAWLQLALIGMALATATLLSWTLVVAGRWRTIAIAFSSLVLAAFVGQQSGIATSLAARLEITERWLLAALWIVSFSLLLSGCLWLLELAGWNWWPRTSSATPPPSTLARFAVVLIAVLLMVPTIDLGWAMVPPSPPARPEPPRPNGYDVLAQIESKLNWDSITADDPLEASLSEATQFTRDNQDRLIEMTTALQLPSQVLIDWRPGYPASSPTSIFHDVFHAWHLAAKAARGGGDDGRAAEYYLEALRASNVCANGGTAIDEFVANALANEATNRLAGLLNQLSDDQIERVQRVTQQCLSDREPIVPFINRSERHERITGGWSGRLSAWFVKRQLSNGFDAAVELPNHRAARDARLKLLIVECSLHRYQLAYGSYPEGLTQLTPDFLQQLPRDPFTNGPFRYRRTDAGYLLYSVNADGIDDGGVQDAYPRLYEGDLMLRPSLID